MVYNYVQLLYCNLKSSCNMQLQAHEPIKLQNSVPGLIHMVVAVVTDGVLSAL